jgi:transposase-like protein
MVTDNLFMSEFMERSIGYHAPYLFVDASYFNVKDDVRYVNKALPVVVSVKTLENRKIRPSFFVDAKQELTWEWIYSGLRIENLIKWIS